MEVQFKSKSRTSILKSAKDLFWKFGIRKVTVEEICREAGISKMSFYRNFQNKQEVAYHVIVDINKRSLKRYRSIMDDDISFQSKVRELVKLKYEEVKGISKEFVKDLYHGQHLEHKKLFDDFGQNMVNEIMCDLKLAQDRGEIRENLRMDFVLYLLNDMNAKLMDEELNKMYKNEEDLIMELTNHFFYGILPS